MSVGNVERGDAAEGRDQIAGAIEPGAPYRVVHAVGRLEVVQRFALLRASHQPIDIVCSRIRQEDDTRLRAQLDDVPCAVVFLVAAGPLVLADDVRLILVDRKTTGDAGLLVRTHPQPVEIERRRIIYHERRALAQCHKVLTRFRIDPGRVRIRVGRQIDLGARDVQKAQGICGNQLARFFGTDDIVGNG